MKHYLPGEVLCPSCGIEVSLSKEQRLKRRFCCPGCKTLISAEKYRIHTRLGFLVEPPKPGRRSLE